MRPGRAGDRRLAANQNQVPVLVEVERVRAAILGPAIIALLDLFPDQCKNAVAIFSEILAQSRRVHVVESILTAILPTEHKHLAVKYHSTVAVASRRNVTGLLAADPSKHLVLTTQFLQLMSVGNAAVIIVFEKALGKVNFTVQAQENERVVKQPLTVIYAAMQKHFIRVDKDGDVALTRRWQVFLVLVQNLQPRPVLGK